MQVQQTTTVTLENQSFEVAKLSNELKQMVAYLDDWRQKEQDLTSELLMVRSAIRDIQGALGQNLQNEIKEAREKAEAFGIVETPAQENTDETN